jgi:hypothetical protein
VWFASIPSAALRGAEHTGGEANEAQPTLAELAAGGADRDTGHRGALASPRVRG